MRSAPLLSFAAALLAAALCALAAPRQALAIEHIFAGSAQLDYHLVPTIKDANARPIGFDGFTTEVAAKLAVDLSDHFSVNVKFCFGCHGLESDMAYVDYRVADELNFRFGRFSPSFGAFNLRHNPANHRLSDKPLPYDMGRMLRLRAWNMGVLPSPFPDNGLEIDGKHAFGASASIDYAVYAVSGFKGDSTGIDLDFVQSRSGSLYYVDNNGRPTVGGRLSLTSRLGAGSDMTLGASGMRGTYDPDNKLSYTILGGDLSFRFDRTHIRFEYLVRRQDIDVSDPTRFRYDIGTNGDFFVKHGAYAELEQPLSEIVDLILRADGMLRIGNVLTLPAGAQTPPDGLLSRSSWVARYTLGTAISIERGLRVKASTEAWQFSDTDAAGHQVAVGVHLAGVASF